MVSSARRGYSLVGNCSRKALASSEVSSGGTERQALFLQRESVDVAV